MIAVLSFENLMFRRVLTLCKRRGPINVGSPRENHIG